MDSVELTAAALGLACVLLTVHQHIACWPTGLAMVVLYLFVFFDARLYSDMLLQGVYVVLQLYGWYAWCRGGPAQSPLGVRRLSARGIMAWSMVSLAAATGLGWGMHTWTDASFPYVDAFATSASLTAQWLMGRKILESWIAWIVVDMVSIGMYWVKELYPTAALYTVFLGLAVWGWWEWSAAWRGTATA